MNALEVLSLLAATGITLCLIVRPFFVYRILKPTAALIIGLLGLQLVVGGYSWRYAPSCLLIFVIATWAFADQYVRNSIITRRVLQGLLTILLPLALLPWVIFLPVPTLPQPIGSYRLSTKTFRWVDSSRHEGITSDTLDRRNVIVQAWYPTDSEVISERGSYLDGLGILPSYVGMIPSEVFDRYDRIDTRAELERPISSVEPRWPVIIFLPGNAASRAFYTSLITQIASFGYVVLAIDHPYDAMVVQLADGSWATNVERNLPGETNLLKFMELRAQTRIEDVKFVIDELIERKISNDFFSHLDVGQIAIVGHSLGGATGAMAMAVDTRIKAAVNIDGTPYGDLPQLPTPRPFLLIESKKDNSERFLRYEQGNQKLFQYFGGGFRYELTQADHYSFTDVPLLLTPLARSLTHTFVGIGGVPEQTYFATAAMVAAFLSDSRLNLDSVASKNEGILKKSLAGGLETSKP